MKTLYTAFKGENNTSFQLVSRLNGRALFLTNSFLGLEKDISSFDCGYDTVYMFGILSEIYNQNPPFYDSIRQEVLKQP